ncbi:MAG TPA: acyl carrier protein [Stellaceae bacterium]|nr:acyl carrier protein [Stellaceae bacterium]
MSVSRSPALTMASVRDHCVQFLAKTLHADAGTIDPAADFDRLGLDSVMAVALVLDLEEWSGLDLEPSLLFEYPTINELAAYVVQTVGEQPQANVA